MSTGNLRQKRRLGAGNDLVNVRTSVCPLWHPCLGPVGTPPGRLPSTRGNVPTPGQQDAGRRHDGDSVKAKNASMVAYDGRMAFKKLSGVARGYVGMVTRRITGRADDRDGGEGSGTCCLADRASEINLVGLTGDKLYVEASNLLLARTPGPAYRHPAVHGQGAAPPRATACSRRPWRATARSRS